MYQLQHRCGLQFPWFVLKDKLRVQSKLKFIPSTQVQSSAEPKCPFSSLAWSTERIGELSHWGWDENGCHFPHNTFKCIFMNENIWISTNILLKFVPKGLINNIPALVQIMAWRQPGDKPLSELMMVSLLMHICVTRPQWVITSYQFLMGILRQKLETGENVEKRLMLT